MLQALDDIPVPTLLELPVLDGVVYFLIDAYLLSLSSPSSYPPGPLSHSPALFDSPP